MTTLATSPRYAKYFRMLRAGLPEGAVRQLMRVQGADERALALGGDALTSDLDPQAPLGPVVDTRVYETSLRMLLVGVPQGAVETALRVRTLDTRAYEQTLGKLRATLAQRQTPLQVVSSPLSERDSEKAAVMMRVGVPEGAVEQRTQLRQQQLELETASPWTNLFLTVATGASADTAIQDHAPLRRFFTMLRAGVAVGAVENALAAASLPRELVHWDPTLPVAVLAVPPV